MSIRLMNKDELENALKLLGFSLDKAGSIPIDIVICGGSSQIIADTVSRPTRDVDVLGVLKKAGGEAGKTVGLEPLPASVLAAAREVAVNLKLDANWLNCGPRELVKYGLPEGFVERLQCRKYGAVLTIWLTGRLDQIHFKLYAAVDTGPGRHVSDLQSLQPTAAECEAAARWVMTHDSSEGFRQTLKHTLEYIGHGDVAARI